MMLCAGPSQRKRAERVGKLPDPEARGTFRAEMRSSLSLQRSLYRHQARQIAQQVQTGSKAFLAYQRRYHHATRAWRKVITPGTVHARIAKADVVYVGDYHTLRLAQRAYLELVTHALDTGRRVVLALEFVEARHQATLDAFLAGKLGEKKFLAKIGHPYRSPFDIWPGFTPLFALARRKKLEVVAIDRRAPGPRSLEVRDEGASQVIARALEADDRPLVLALVGQFHIAPGHLPRRVDALSERKLESLIVYQNAEGIYWSLAERGLAESTRAVEISDRELCLVNASPVVCQRSFLDYVEAEAGDSPLDEAGIAQTFRHLARDIGKLVGVDVRSASASLEVLTPSTTDFLERIQRRGRFSRVELKQLEKHVLSLESGWIPRANAVWLASMSLNHAAEEAAHFVRTVGAKSPIDRERGHADAFWARCLEEALGFFGSRLVNPKRRAIGLDEWGWHFQNQAQTTVEKRQIAAFTLALSTALKDDVASASTMVPGDAGKLFHGVSHALGYLLGEAMAKAFERGSLKPAAVRQLFRDPFDTPVLTFAALCRRFSAFGRSNLGPRARQFA